MLVKSQLIFNLMYSVFCFIVRLVESKCCKDKVELRTFH